MDGTLQDYHKLKHLAIKERIALLIKEVRETNGCYISLWHNESLSDQNRWKGWRAIFEFQQQYLSKQ
jgi:myosin-crossreactive antigen